MNAKIFVILLALSLPVDSTITGQSLKKIYLVMRTTGELQLHDGNMAPMYGFAANKIDAPVFPAPTITVNAGDTVDVEATNISQLPHTIHFHGLDMNEANGGNPVTSFALSHRQKFTYRFVANHTGTFIYYSHASAVPHAALGMYGLVIVLGKKGARTARSNGPAFDNEYSWITSEIDTLWNNYFLEMTEEDVLKSLPPFAPQYFLINAKSAPSNAANIHLTSGGCTYLRLANAGLTDNQYIFPKNLQPYLIDADGRPLPLDKLIDTLLVSPGQRCGIMLYPNSIGTTQVLLNYINLITGSVEGSKKLTAFIVENIDIHQNEIVVNAANNYKTNTISIAFKYPIHQPVEIYYYNIQGQLLAYENFQFVGYNRTLEFPIMHLRQGFYYLKIKVGAKEFYKQIVLTE